MSSSHCASSASLTGAHRENWPAFPRYERPFRYRFRYPVLATVFHETHWHRYGSLAGSRAGLSVSGPMLGLGATPLRSDDLRPRNPHSRNAFCYLSGVAPSPRLRRDRSLREGSEPARGGCRPAACDASDGGAFLHADEGIQPQAAGAAPDLVAPLHGVGVPVGLRLAEGGLLRPRDAGGDHNGAPRRCDGLVSQ